MEEIGLIMVLLEVTGPPKQSTSTKSIIKKRNGKKKRICTNNYYMNYISICSYIWPETQFSVSKNKKLRISGDNIVSDDVCLHLSLQPTSNGSYEEKMKSAAASLVDNMVVLDWKID